jgi:hypothetical protein
LLEKAEKLNQKIIEVQERKARYLYDKKLGTLSKIKKKSIEFRKEEKQRYYLEKKMKYCSGSVLLVV